MEKPRRGGRTAPGSDFARSRLTMSPIVELPERALSPTWCPDLIDQNGHMGAVWVT
jgi:hypothetical protein